MRPGGLCSGWGAGRPFLPDNTIPFFTVFRLWRLCTKSFRSLFRLSSKRKFFYLFLLTGGIFSGILVLSNLFPPAHCAEERPRSPMMVSGAFCAKQERQETDALRHCRTSLKAVILMGYYQYTTEPRLGQSLLSFVFLKLHSKFVHFFFSDSSTFAEGDVVS